MFYFYCNLQCIKLDKENAREKSVLCIQKTIFLNRFNPCCCLIPCLPLLSITKIKYNIPISVIMQQLKCKHSQSTRWLTMKVIKKKEIYTHRYYHLQYLPSNYHRRATQQIGFINFRSTSPFKSQTNINHLI